MSEATLRNAITRVMESGRKKIEFIFYGGEALLMPVDFYRKAVDLEIEMLKPGQEIYNGMQTNMTCLTDSMVEALKYGKVCLGTSLDGPKEIHDKVRQDNHGRGTFDRVMAGIKKARAADLPVEAICTITRYNHEQIEEVYSFFKQEGLAFKLNNLFLHGNACSHKNELDITADQWAESAIKMFNLWKDDRGNGPMIINFKRILENMVIPSDSQSDCSDSCANRFLLISPNGDCYPCQKFDGSKDYSYGNINESSLQELFSSNAHQCLENRASSLDECIACSFHDLCNGGCGGNAYIAFGNPLKKDNLCSAYKKIYSHISKALKEETDKAVVK